MKGEELKEARLKKGLTQQQAAERLGVTQAYFSMLEHGYRAMPYSLARKAAETLNAPATTIPLRGATSSGALDSERLRAELAALGYPGFAHVRRMRRRNPAELLQSALNEPELDTRAVEGLPWLVVRYADMDWDWLVRNAKLMDRQNRLGFVVTLAHQLTAKSGEPERFRKLKEYLGVVERSRLAKEDTLCHDSMTEAEKVWLRQNRTQEAAHWNLLTDMRTEDLPHAEL